MVLQCLKLFYYRVLRQDSQSSYSFGKIQKVGEAELSEEKIWCFIGERFHISFQYIFSVSFAFCFFASNTTYKVRLNCRDRKLVEDLNDLITRTWAWFVRIESKNFINRFKFHVSNCAICIIKRSHFYMRICFYWESSYLSISKSFSSTDKRNRLSSRLNA